MELSIKEFKKQQERLGIVPFASTITYKTIQKHGPMMSYYSFLYSIYFDIVKRMNYYYNELISGFQISSNT